MADAEAESNAVLSSAFKPPSLLPIAKFRDELLYTIDTFPVTIVIGQTGSGKTTQLPQFLSQAGWSNDGKMVGITQPRRVAVTSVAHRVAEEMQCAIGQEVGYSIRFEDLTSSKTKIKFLTDGLLLREALVDPLLSRYSVIMVDEAHERTLSSDVLLGILKKIMKKRPELRIVVSSATIEAEVFLQFFNDDSEAVEYHDHKEKSKIFFLGGRMYPVDLHYLEDPAEDYVERSLQTIFDIHTGEADGDILVFLSGREEIETVVQEVNSRAADLPPKAKRLQPMALFAGLSTEQQMDVFQPAPDGTRKVVVATNIAEASVTIEGIAYVIDCGFVKLRSYNPVSGIDSLTTTPVSKASAIQRAGRAGRVRPGKCYRLYTEADHAALEDQTPPEILRSNLAPLLLQLKALGIDNIARFDFLVSPPAKLVIRALELLYSLGALDDYAKLTRPLGNRMAELAVEPMMAKALLSAGKFGCLSEMLSIAAMTSLQGSVWFHHEGEKKAMEGSRRKFAAEEGDTLTSLNVYQTFVTTGKKDVKWCRDNHLNFKSMTRAVSIRNQLRRYLERFGIDVSESLAGGRSTSQPQVQGEAIRRCLTTGFFQNAARMQPDGTFQTINGAITLHAHPTSLLFNRKADWVIFHEVIETSHKTFIRDVTKIEKAWLVEYAPEFYRIT